MRLALDDAGLEAGAIDVVYASANATRALDAAAAQALTRLFGCGRAVVTSVKGALGEFGAAAARRARRRCCAGGGPGAADRRARAARSVGGDAAARTREHGCTRTDRAGQQLRSGGALFSAVLRVASLLVDRCWG